MEYVTFSRRSRWLTLVALCVASAVHSHAAPAPALGWHVQLRSGFDLTCARMDAHGDKMRLFLHPAGEDFLDINSAEIVSSEQVELPADPAPAVTGGDLIRPETPFPAALSISSLTSAAQSQYNLDADLIASIIHAESAGNPHAVSRTGARGLMQLMPGTAGEVGVSDAFNPAQNVNGGTAYFNQLLVLYHDNLPLALAAYNAGPGAVARYHGIPPYRETQAYVRRVINEFNRRKRLARSASKAVSSNFMLASAASK
jgi:hypothetical protein